MNKIKLIKESIPHVISFILLLTALVFSLNKNDFSLGEYVFTKFGIGIWSNKTSGLYYPGFFSIFLCIIFFIDLIFLTKGINKKFILITLCIAVFWNIVAIPAFNFGYSVIKSKEPGLACIDEIKKDCIISYKAEFDKLNIDGKVKLENFSNDEKEFYIKYKPSASNCESQ